MIREWWVRTLARLGAFSIEFFADVAWIRHSWRRPADSDSRWEQKRG